MWQRKRNSIVERDNYECQLCGDLEKAKQVHHLEYIVGNAPWEYPDDSLITLCDNCHKSESDWFWNDKRKQADIWEKRQVARL